MTASSGHAAAIGTQIPWITDVLTGRLDPVVSATPATGVPEPAMGAVALICILALSRHRGGR